MTIDQICEAVATGKIKPQEAKKLIDELTPPTVKVVGTTFADVGDFLKHAKQVTLTGDGMSITLKPKEFSTGSYGWCSSGKLVVQVDGKPVRVQGSINLVVIGSKPEAA